jgi:transcriptional regulator GlxA family with amidase domain
VNFLQGRWGEEGGYPEIASERRIAPRDVCRVIEYVQRHLGEPIILADLVRESGVAGRTLLKHFHDFKGVSPMRHVRNLRLERVRIELLAGGARTVSEVALNWGFPHLGRFSIEYRRRFGESPSATLARHPFPGGMEGSN